MDTGTIMGHGRIFSGRTIAGMNAALRRQVAVIAACCMLLCGFSARIDAANIDYESLDEAIACQSDLLYFFSFSSLPLEIIDHLVRTGTPRSGMPENGKRRTPQQNTDTHGGSPADYSLMKIDKTKAVVHAQGAHDGSRSVPLYAVPLAAPPVATAGPERTRRWRSCLYRWSLTGYFFLLPRSDTGNGICGIFVMH